MPVVSKALIVGGGIGGLTAGVALRRAGIAADLIGSAVFSEAELVRLQRWLDDVHRRVTVAEGRE